MTNNCPSCEWKQIQTADVDSHCYMFREEPAGACAQYKGIVYDKIEQELSK